MITNKFKVEGMTCESCVEKITEKLKSISNVDSVNVNLQTETATITSDTGLKLQDVSEALKVLPKYSVSEVAATSSNISKSLVNSEKESKLKTYKPLIVVFTYVSLISLSYQYYQGHFDFHLFMNHIMAGFFIGLSFFKFLDLNAFAQGFSSYDPLAQRVPAYGKIYPFVELSLGLMFVASFNLFYANLLTIIILSLTTFGVIKQLQSKSKFQCACLGAGFNLPLSYVTVFENVVMILMALYGLT